MKQQNVLFGAQSATKYFYSAIFLLGIVGAATFAASPRPGVDNRLLEAEQILSGLGYWVLTVDGKADASTRHAITAFQKVERLKRTGILTGGVLEALRFASRPSARFNTGRAHVEIDITRQVLFLTDAHWEQNALHLVVESQFIFMGSKQATTVEYWITNDRTYERRGSRVIINRKDRGVQWVIDTEEGTYSETRNASPLKNLKSEEDIRTAGFNYEPEFAWNVANSRKVTTINGRTCRLTTATGIDDFAEMTLKLLLCHTSRPALELKANVFVLESARFRYQNPVNLVTELVSKRPNMLIMSLEATVEPPISTKMHHRVEVLTIESGPPPNGIFDLPVGIQKGP